MLNHIGTQKIDTNRLTLRRYEVSDADDIFLNWVTDKEVTRFWNWEPHKDIKETKYLLQGWIDKYNNKDNYHWVIILKEESQAIGYIFVNEIDNDDETASLHCIISKKHWNKGFATEASKAVIAFAFTEIGIRKIQTRHHVNNPASGRALQKSGMRFVKIAYKHFPSCERLNGDYYFYEIIKDE
jgi:RimJ/RimL family protein N-acetyltransferase